MIGDVVSDEITRELLDPFYGYPRALNMFAVWMIVVTPLTKFGLCSRPLNVAVEGFLALAPAPAVVAAAEQAHAHEHAAGQATEYLAPGAGAGAGVGGGGRVGGGGGRRQSFSDALGSAFSAAGLSDYVDDDATPTAERPKSPLGGSLGLPAPEAPHEGRKGLARIACRVAMTAACTATAVLLPGFGQVMAFLGSFSAFLICIILPVSQRRGERSERGAVHRRRGSEPRRRGVASGASESIARAVRAVRAVRAKGGVAYAGAAKA